MAIYGDRVPDGLSLARRVDARGDEPHRGARSCSGTSTARPSRAARRCPTCAGSSSGRSCCTAGAPSSPGSSPSPASAACTAPRSCGPTAPGTPPSTSSPPPSSATGSRAPPTPSARPRANAATSCACAVTSRPPTRPTSAVPSTATTRSPGRPCSGSPGAQTAAALGGGPAAARSSRGPSVRRSRVLPGRRRRPRSPRTTSTPPATCARELDGLAESFGSEVLARRRPRRRGVGVELALGDPAGALPYLRKAHQAWVRLDMPHEAALAQAATGRALVALGDHESGPPRARVGARGARGGRGAGPTSIDARPAWARPPHAPPVSPSARSRCSVSSPRAGATRRSRPRSC